MSDNNRVCRNTLTMVNIIYINLNHLYTIMFLFLTLFVSMILQLATISYVSQLMLCAQINVYYNRIGHGIAIGREQDKCTVAA